jgi:hypothetical protein
VKRGRNVIVVPITVVTNLLPVGVILARIQLYRPSIVHTRMKAAKLADFPSIMPPPPVSALNAADDVPALSSLVGSSVTNATMRPVSFRLSALNKKQLLYIPVHNPSDYPLAVSVAVVCCALL